MTKVRQPATFADAVTRIAGRIGWEAAGEAVGKCSRSVRNWSDPDMSRAPTIEEALALDAAYLGSGGAEAPMLAVYQLQLERRASRPDPSADIAAVASTTAKEVGEAVAALVAAAMPGAGIRDREQAEREIAEAQEALAEAQRRLTAGAHVTQLRRGV